MLDLTNPVLLTAVSIVASNAVAIFATWYYSKRRYSRPPRPTAAEDIELERAKNELRAKV